MYFNVQHLLDDPLALGGRGRAGRKRANGVKELDAVGEFLSRPSPYRQPPSTSGIFDLPDAAKLIESARRLAVETASGVGRKAAR